MPGGGNGEQPGEKVPEPAADTRDAAVIVEFPIANPEIAPTPLPATIPAPAPEPQISSDPIAATEPAHGGDTSRQDDPHRGLRRLISDEAERLFEFTKWFVGALGVAIGIEVLVSYLEDFPKLHFVTNVLDILGKFMLYCDASVLGLVVFVGTLLAWQTLLDLIGIDIIKVGRWIGTWIRSWFKR